MSEISFLIEVKIKVKEAADIFLQHVQFELKHSMRPDFMFFPPDPVCRGGADINIP